MRTINNLTEEFLTEYPDKDFQINQGASLLLIQDNNIIFTLTKKKKWKIGNDITEIKFSGIGGSLEKDETIFKCLKRETMEEIGLDLNDIKFPDLSETFIVNNDKSIEKSKLMVKDQEPKPLYIIRLKLPLREDTNEKQKKYSALQLVVYLAKINSNKEINTSEDSIPGLLMVNKEALNDVLDGKILLEENNNNDKVIIKWNEHYLSNEKKPKRIHLVPQFTPIGLRKTNLSFEEMIKFWNK